MCSQWRPFVVDRSMPEAPRQRVRKTIVDPKVTRQHIGIMSPAPASQDSSRYAARLAATIMGDHAGSRLFYALVEPAIADEANMAYDGLDGTGAYITFLSADPQRAGEAIRIAENEFRKFLDEGPSDEEMTAAKNKIASSATLKGELPIGRMTTVGFDWVYRREYLPLKEQIDILMSVTPQQVLEVVRKYDMTATTVVSLGPADVL